MHFTILHVGETPASLRDRYDRFPPLFQTMFASAGADYRFDTVEVVAGAPVPDAADIEGGVILTGSAFGVYDSPPWIEPLRAFIRTAYARRTPMLGVCFGHQIMADALGGEVRKSDKGWGIGRQDYRVVAGHDLFDAVPAALSIPASHQDQVLTPPADAQVFLTSDFAPNAGLIYGNGAALSVQPHPEFDRVIAAALCELRRDNPLTDARVDHAVASLDAELHNTVLARAFMRFFAGRERS